jgi:hypothetical protein
MSRRRLARWLAEPGTTIVDGELYEGVARHIANEAFENKLRTAISEHFTMFLQWGLKVELNGKPIDPVRVEVLVSTREEGPAPFVFRKKIDVWWSQLQSAETQTEVSGTKTMKMRDLSATGRPAPPDGRCSAMIARSSWATRAASQAGRRHPALSPTIRDITGIIEFRSKTADKLPVTHHEACSRHLVECVARIASKNEEGMRVWIDYSNQWKNESSSEQEQASQWETARVRWR